MTGRNGASDVIVDGHAHVWPSRLIHPDQKRQTPLRATPIDLLRVMGGSGVQYALVSPAVVYPRNDYVLSAHKASRRIVPVAGIAIDDPDPAASVLRDAVAGAAGIRVTERSLSAILSRGTELLLQTMRAAEHGDLVVQWTVPLTRSDLVANAATGVPSVRHVIDHLGLPSRLDRSSLDRIKALASLPNMCIKLSGMYALSAVGYPYEDVWEWAESVVDAFGQCRVIWASDWPLSQESASYADQLSLTRRLPFLDAAAQRAILGENAMEIWRLGRRTRRLATP